MASPGHHHHHPLTNHPPLPQDSLLVASSALEHLLHRVSHALYIKTVLKKIKPYLARKIQLETLALVHTCYLPHDRKEDDQWLGED